MQPTMQDDARPQPRGLGRLWLRTVLWLGLWLGAGLATTGTAAAQGPAGQQGNGSLPFSNIVRRPSMSPYNALGFQGNNPTTGGTLGAMQGLVRPQQQQLFQQQQAARQSRQLSQMQRQMQQVQRPMTGGASVETIRATGHASTYMNMSHFYPATR
ncbi:MAG: hypothetical protein ACKO6B_11705 [Planctomycetia bacterium]